MHALLQVYLGPLKGQSEGFRCRREREMGLTFLTVAVRGQRVKKENSRTIAKTTDCSEKNISLPRGRGGDLGKRVAKKEERTST